MSKSNALFSSNIDFSFLDAPSIKAKYAIDQAQTKVCFYISGIQCEKCVRKLEGLVGNLPGLRRLRVEMGKNLAHVELDPSQLNFSEVADAIEQLGFHPIPLNRDQDFAINESKEDRSRIIRLAVAGACAGNIMTFAFAAYLGGDLQLFSWLAFVLYLPVVTYVAWPFYVGAWTAVRQKRISIDLPMAVASLLGFSFSTVELLRGKPDVYFDSLSGFLFLILVSRWAQRRLQRKFLNPGELLEGLRLDRVRVIQPGKWVWAPTETLMKNQEFLIFEGETLCADAELLSSSAVVSLAWLSGEAKPKTFLKGSIVPAGAKILSVELKFLVKTPLAKTEFGKLLSEVQKFSLSENRTIMDSDRWAQWLLGTVFTCAFVFVAFYWHISPEEAIRRAMALLVLACPCAMAFGTPLALAVSLKKAAKEGLVIRNADVFESVKKATTIFLDKTGTLTETELSLIETDAQIPKDIQKIVLSLENNSVHPIAFALRNSLFADDLHTVKAHKETPGVGVSGFIENRFYELVANPSSSDSVSCVLRRESLPIMVFHFSSEYRPGCKEVLNNLRARGLHLVLLSGDSPVPVEKVGSDLGFSKSDTYSRLLPEAKAFAVIRYPNAIMVGDGINDSLALQRASVGVAASGGVEAALKSANVYLGEKGLFGLVSLFELSDQAFSLIRQNLLISVIYNSVGGTLALMGFVNPLVAALLMPVSSGFILMSTWIKSRQ